MGVTEIVPVDESPARSWRTVPSSVRSLCNIPNVYLAVALIWGIALVVVVPPLQSFDELAHYYRAWSVSRAELFVPASGAIELPAGADSLTQRFAYAPIAMHKKRVQVSAILAELGSPMGQRLVRSSSFASSYDPIGYIPQAAAFLAVRVLGGSPLVALYLGRFLNLVCAILLTYLGLRFLPFARLAVCLVALLPMTMMQMASLSPDALTLGGSLFFIGLVVACSAKKTVSRRDIALLIVAAIVLLNAKPPYAVLSLLVLLLLPRQFTSRLAYWCTMIGAILCSGAILLLFMKLFPGSPRVLRLMLGPNNHVNSGAQLSHVLHHPLGFARAIGATINQLGMFYLRQSVAAYAWGQLNIGDVVMLIAAVGLAAVLAVRERVSLAAWRRVLILGVALAAGLGVSLGLYMGFTPVGAPAVVGLQGRYFTPSVALAFVGLAGFPFNKKWLVPVIIGAVIFLLIIFNLRTILVYYY